MTAKVGIVMSSRLFIKALAVVSSKTTSFTTLVVSPKTTSLALDVLDSRYISLTSLSRLPSTLVNFTAI